MSSPLIYPIHPILDGIIRRETGWRIDHIDDMRTKRWVHPKIDGVIVELYSGRAVYWPPGCTLNHLVVDDGGVRCASIVEAIAAAQGFAQ